MDALNINATIARERRAAGITQEQLAAHLGVTKAAVSKWELGQSLPDAALLPLIASYFHLTLDQLFDYRPQLSRDEVKDVCRSLLRQFSEDAEAAYARMDDLIAQYYSCWLFLVQMGTLYVQRAAFEPARAGELASKAEALLVRVETCGDDWEAVRGARVLRSAAMQMHGDLDGAIELMESMKPDSAWGLEAMLATLYFQKGDREACLRISQESVFQGLMGVMQSVSLQLSLCEGDAPRMDALLQVGEGVMRGFGLEGFDRNLAAGFLSAASAACLVAGDDDRALAYLERFTDVVEGCDVSNVAGYAESLLFDRMESLRDGAEDGEPMYGPFDQAQLRGAFKACIFGAQPWIERAGDARFKPQLDRLAAL